eukprot:365763-Chlamydomonas_euryale.AAC.15
MVAGAEPSFCFKDSKTCRDSLFVNLHICSRHGALRRPEVEACEHSSGLYISCSLRVSKDQAQVEVKWALRTLLKWLMLRVTPAPPPRATFLWKSSTDFST